MPIEAACLTLGGRSGSGGEWPLAHSDRHDQPPALSDDAEASGLARLEIARDDPHEIVARADAPAVHRDDHVAAGTHVDAVDGDGAVTAPHTRRTGRAFGADHERAAP